MTPGATVNIFTFSDEDYIRVFRHRAGNVYTDFSDKTLRFMLRKSPSDPEVFISLVSSIEGVLYPNSGIDIYQFDEIISGDDVPVSGDFPHTAFALILDRSDLARLPEGEYVHSLIMENATGWRDSIWRGTLTHKIGPTR